MSITTDIDALPLQIGTGDREVRLDRTRFLYHEPGISSDSILVSRMQSGGLRIEIDEPWSGSTEEGFGRSTSIILPPDAVKAFINWLSVST